MKITPIDVSHKSFSKKMFGVDENEVQEFLQQVSAQLEEVIHERNSLRETIREKEINLHEFKERDQVLKNTITTASQMSERIRQDAEREAKLVIADAQQKAEIIMRDSRDSLKKIYQEIADLKRIRMQFEANLRALAQAHISLLEQGEKYVPPMSLPQVEIEEAPAAAAKTQNVAKATRSNEISPLSSSQS